MTQLSYASERAQAQSALFTLVSASGPLRIYVQVVQTTGSAALSEAEAAEVLSESSV